MSNRHEKERGRQERRAAEQAKAQRAARREMLIWAATIVGAAAAITVAVVLVVSHRNGGSLSASATAAPAVPTRGVPRPIAANARQANQVLDGSIKDKLEQLKGVPVVVNQWASWCPDCKQEFPFFQALARSLGRRVAFVGLDSQDKRGDAESFLRSFPVAYPSIYDAGADQARSLGGGQGWPTTFYFDRTGRETYVREGGYASLALLRGDIKRYALGEQ